MLDFDEAGDYMVADVKRSPKRSRRSRADALVRSLMGQFEQYVQLSKKVPEEVLSSLVRHRRAGSSGRHDRRADGAEGRQTAEHSRDRRGRADGSNRILALLDAEIDLFQVEKRIRGRVKKQMEKSQREYYLNEQMKAIQKELGDLDDGRTKPTT